MLAKLAQEGAAATVSLLFLIGAGTQVFIAFINKVECWYCYYGCVAPRYAGSARGQFMLWLDNQLWIDVLCDLATIGCFGAAIILIFSAYT